MSNIDKIVEAIGTLNPNNEEHFTRGGVPSVEAIEAVAGISEVTAAERDEAWDICQAATATADAEAEAEIKAKEETDKATADLLAAGEKGFFVEEGKSVTSRKGIKGPGERVVARDFGEGDVGVKILKDLCERGIVKEVK